MKTKSKVDVEMVAERLVGGKFVKFHGSKLWCPGHIGQTYGYIYEHGDDTRLILKERKPGLLGVMAFKNQKYDYIVYEDGIS